VKKVERIEDVRKKFFSEIGTVSERLSDPSVRDITGCGVKFACYRTGDERTGVVTSITFDLRTASWVCSIRELPGGKLVQRKYGSVEVVLSASEVAQAESDE
jgi:hypothetical protein